jgi:hypothetical protein
MNGGLGLPDGSDRGTSVDRFSERSASGSVRVVPRRMFHGERQECDESHDDDEGSEPEPG